MERGLLAPLHFSLRASPNPSPRSTAGTSPKNVAPQLFRLVAVEYLMGKGLTGGGSRRYLWALFVVRFDVPLRTNRLCG
jgi:hypothetical protein